MKKLFQELSKVRKKLEKKICHLALQKSLSPSSGSIPENFGGGGMEIGHTIWSKLHHLPVPTLVAVVEVLMCSNPNVHPPLSTRRWVSLDTCFTGRPSTRTLHTEVKTHETNPPQNIDRVCTYTTQRDPLRARKMISQVWDPTPPPACSRIEPEPPPSSSADVFQSWMRVFL